MSGTAPSWEPRRFSGGRVPRSCRRLRSSCRRLPARGCGTLPNSRSGRGRPCTPGWSASSDRPAAVFRGGDAKLQESIAGRVAPEKAAAYQRQIGTMKTAQPVSGARGHGAEKKDEVVDGVPGGCGGLNGVWIAVGAEMFERDDQLVLDDSRN